jgi:3-oxoacyl-[acyl-carrier-protein] synthase-3
MALPEVYLSAPAVVLPGRKVDNEELLGRVRRAFRGPGADWDDVERRIRFVWKQCGSKERWLAEEQSRPVADHAVRAAQACLAAQGIAADALDAVIYGGIPREYFEPATAAEIAAKLGATRAAVYDVASACAGLLLGVHAWVGHAAVDEFMRTGIVTCADLTADRLSYDVQTAADLELLAAGLTIGNAAAAMVLSRTPTAACGRIVAMLVESLPEHHALTRAPVDGHFTCRSTELFGLARHVPDHVGRLLSRAGWAAGDVAWIASHQPSERLLREVARKIGVDPARVPSVHDRYGNAASSSVPLALDAIVREQGLSAGDRVVLSTQAAGFVMCSMALEWQGSLSGGPTG